MHVDSDCLERFVRESPWEHEQVINHLRRAAPEGVQGPDAAVIVDGMGIPKKGDHSVGVARQWCGATGKIDNCQVTVNCTLAKPGNPRNADQVTWPLGTRLYLTKKWAGGDASIYDSSAEHESFAQRRHATRIPTTVAYQTKYDIAADMLEQLQQTDLKYGCVLGDSNFGMRSGFRKRLQAMNQPYLLEIETGRLFVVPEHTEIREPGSSPGPGRPRLYHTLPSTVTPETATDVAARFEDEDWTQVTWNKGTKGDMSGTFYRERIRVVTKPHHRRASEETGWLLLQQDYRPGGPEKPGELKAWLCWGLDETSLDEVVRWAHLRWTIEQFHKNIKQILGADQF